MNLALLELEFLNHLDLSMNNFNAISIPSIPNDVISDSNLQYLDLSLSGYNLSMDNLNWLSQLSSLKQLDLRGTDLHKETNWLLAMPPSLSNLYLRDMCMIRLRLLALNEYGNGVIDILIGNVHHIGWCIVWEANHMEGRCACFEFAHHGVIRTSQIFAYHI